MIWLYSGTPGSGKSYHATVDAIKKIKRKDKNKVIANYMLFFEDDEKKMEDNFIYIDNFDLTVEFLENFAIENHVFGVEGQTLLIIDEAQIIFNSRSWNSNPKSRMNWIKFFSQHRKFGYNIILIAQFDRMIDRQIRSLVEYEVSHMKVNNFFVILPISCFLAVERWYSQKMKINSSFIFYRKKYSSYYNSYKFFEVEKKSDMELIDS